jgi:hypothetical protein
MNATSTELRSAHDDLLRRSLVADAVVTGAAGLLLAVAAGPLADPLGLPVLLMRITGIALLPYAAVVMLIGTRGGVSRTAAWVIVGLNLIWAIDSVLLLLTGWVDSTALGIAFVLAQALLVAAFADIQFLGLRRSA